VRLLPQSPEGRPCAHPPSAQGEKKRECQLNRKCSAEHHRGKLRQKLFNWRDTEKHLQSRNRKLTKWEKTPILLQVSEQHMFDNDRKKYLLWPKTKTRDQSYKK
jgi:hypothetical protein